MIEIERKFLVDEKFWLKERMAFLSDRAYLINQAYLPSGKGVTVRVRTRTILRDQATKSELKEAFLTIKGPTAGISRPEYEYAIPFDDAVEMMEMRDRPIISKIRHEITVGDHLWEVDSFQGENEGLLLAEIELKSEDEDFVRPEWLGEEVTDDPRYSNARLAKNPFSKWKDRETEISEMFEDIKTLTKVDWDAINSVCNLNVEGEWRWHEFGESGKGCMLSDGNVIRPLDVFSDAMLLATKAKMRVDFSTDKVGAAITDGNNSVCVVRAVKEIALPGFALIRSTKNRAYHHAACQAIVRAILEHHKRRA